MGSYQNPLRVSSDDPLCSSSALGNAIIGILFEKTGKDIKIAIQARMDTIDEKIMEYEGVIGKIKVFIDEKKKIIKELDDYDTARDDEKDALLKPLNEQLEDLRREYQKKQTELDTIKAEKTAIFNKETLAEVSKKAVVFEESFDVFKGTMKDVEEFMKKEQEKSVIESVRGCGFGDTVNIYSPQLSSDCLKNSGTITSNDGGTYFSTTSNNIVGINDSSTAMLNVYPPTNEDKAYCRIQTLKSLLSDYERRVEILNGKIKNLKEEMRRLALIYRNIEDGRAYKLDLNKLSAFGFEDIEVA
jgi:peptidoglycan hydrolase CwlO-like protein